MLSEANKIEQFIQGLCPKVRRGMSYAKANTFWEAVAKAMNIERD